MQDCTATRPVGYYLSDRVQLTIPLIFKVNKRLAQAQRRVSGREMRDSMLHPAALNSSVDYRLFCDTRAPCLAADKKWAPRVHNARPKLE